MSNLRAFSAGANLFGMIGCAVLFIGSLFCIKKEEKMRRPYLLMTVVVFFLQFFEVIMIVCEGHKELEAILIVSNMIYSNLEELNLICFWIYLSIIFPVEKDWSNKTKKMLLILFIPSVLVYIIDMFGPYISGFDENGYYFEGKYYWLAFIYTIIILFYSAILIIRSKVSINKKRVAAFYITIPYVFFFLSKINPDCLIQYPGNTATLALMYMVLNVDSVNKQLIMESELATAQKMQRQMLPKPCFEEGICPEVDLYASMTAAHEVGGDFYDYFKLDDDRLAILIADVSDKGSAASLFMAVSKSLIKFRSAMGGGPSEVLKHIDKWILDNYTSDIFVTVWLGYLNLKTGSLISCNAGHEYPVVFQKKDSEEKFKIKTTEHGPALGMFPGLEFPETEMKLNNGDRIFLFTDGLIEAQGSNGVMFGEERMLEVLNKNIDVDNRTTCKNMIASIEEYVGEAPQFDDLTMLGFTYLG